MAIKYIKGDIRDTHCKVIAHGVNCQNKMGSGVARALFEKWPKVKEDYHNYCEELIPLIGKISNLLGFFHEVYVKDKIILNLLSQDKFGYDNKKYVSYYAISKGFHKIRGFLRDSDIEEIAIPKIGCGLAGGDWNVVSALIEEAMEDIDVYVYVLEE